MNILNNESNSSTLNVTVLGAGAWGTAMAIHMAQRGHSVILAPRTPSHALELQKNRRNDSYLPDCPFPENLQISIEPESWKDSDLIFLGCPSQGVVEFCNKIQKIPFSPTKEKPMIVTLCKGFVPESQELPLAVVERLLPDFPNGALSGPSHAKDVALGLPTAIVLASKAPEKRVKWIQNAINSRQLRIYRSSDVLGVELGGCLKNPYAIGMGIASNLGCGDNARAALFTRMMNELARIGEALGGQHETFFGLSGLGDLLATSEGSWSRNRTFGERIAKGESPEQILSSQKTVVEGYRSTKAFYQICQKLKISAPIMSEIYGILYEGRSPDDAIEAFMGRSLKAEDD